MINFIRNIFRKNEDKVFEIEKVGKVETKRIGTKEQFKDRNDRQILICKDCSEEFILTDSERNFYNKNEIPLPKRCHDCRKARKKY